MRVLSDPLRTIAVLAGVLPLLLGACTVGPDFERPAAPGGTSYLPASSPTPEAKAPAASIGGRSSVRWWTAFGSPALDALVDRALAHNRTLAASNATLARARAEFAAARGTRLPQVDANARLDQEQVNLASFGFGGSDSGLDLGGNPEFGLYTVGGGISYDLDLFGGRKRRIEQAAAEAEAQLRQTEAAHLTVAGQVVVQVLTAAAITTQIDTIQTLIDEDGRNVDLTERRRRGGTGTLVDVLNAQAQLASDHTLLPPLRQQLADARHALAVLIGELPADVELPQLSLDAFTLPRDIPVSLPSELVHVRPDILQAEADLHAATAAVGIATARLYPDITLGATLTQGSPNIDSLLKNAFRGYDLFAGLTAPIFHGGSLKAGREAAIAEARAADARYQQTVLDSFRQVASLLDALRIDQQLIDSQSESLTTAGRSRNLSRRSFEVGNSGILQVLDAERIYQRSLAGLADARGRQFLNVARLYVATAGGWVGTLPVATP